jgi:hypothetical protein
MARQAREQPRGGQPEEEYGKDNTPLYIALGAAGVIGIALVIIFAGSSPEGEYVEAARAALREVLKACIENDAEEGVKLVDPRWVLRDENPDMLKKWKDLTEERREKLTDQAFRWIQMKVENDLKFQDMGQVDVLLAAADSKYKPNEKRVDLAWSYAGTRWNAALSNGTGVWLLLRLDKARGVRR